MPLFLCNRRARSTQHTHSNDDNGVRNREGRGMDLVEGCGVREGVVRKCIHCYWSWKVKKVRLRGKGASY
jgi:hypothetical protein